MVQKIEGLESLDVIEKRVEIMVAGRLRRKDRTKKAIQIQDKLSKKSGSWEGAEEIKKWRKMH